MYASQLEAQQGNIWYFGNHAGLSFNSTPPKPIHGGEINTFEGTSVMCDENGDLLFYTDGVTVYNKIHEPMLNGLDLKGHRSAYQSCIIVPKPGSRYIYYIFTADAWENQGENGYCYSEVDIRLDNGLGAVTIKNVFLNGPSSERLAAIKASDNNSYWVLTNEWGTNVFRAYKVHCNGVNTNPVVSAVGRVMNEHTYCNIGAMRISPDGKYLLQTNVKGRVEVKPVNEYFQVFDFNDASGQVSNARLITLVNDGYYFGGEISPNSQFAYVVNPFSGTIHQFDITLGSAAAIQASKQVIGAGDGLTGIAAGPDQKMYLTTGGLSLHVINQPNVAGPGCNLVTEQQPLTGNSILALPNIIPNLYVNRPVDFTFQLVGSCNGQVQFNANVQLPGLQLQWDFGDGNQATGSNPMHTYANAGNEYVVKLTATDNTNCVFEIVSKRVRPGGQAVTANFGMTTDCDKLTVQLSDSSTSGGGNISYNWNFGDGNTSTAASPRHVYASHGVYTVSLTVTSSNGCIADTKTAVVNMSKPTVNAGPDIEISTIGPVQLQATGALTYQWKPSLYLDNPNIANPVMKARGAVTYVVTGTNELGCSDTDVLEVSVVESETAEVPNAFNPSGTRNPVLRPVLRKMKQLNYFRVYNRWGQLVFSTKTIGQGWDGTIKGLPQPSGAYVWVLEVVDLQDKIIRKQGSSLLLR